MSVLTMVELGRVTERLFRSARSHKLVSAGLASVALYGGASISEEINFTIKPNTIAYIDAMGDQHDSYDRLHAARLLRNTVCLHFPGLGMTDLADDAARAYAPVTSERCLVAPVKYSNAGVKIDRLADDIEDFLRAHTDLDSGVRVTIVAAGSSMGGIVAYNTLQELTRRDPNIVVSVFLADSSPTGTDTLKGAAQKFVVTGGSLIDSLPLPIGHGFDTPLKIGGGVLSKLMKNEIPKTQEELGKEWEDILYVAGRTDVRLYYDQLGIIKEGLSGNSDFLKDSVNVFAHPDTIDGDDTVYWPDALNVWRAVVPTMHDETILGGKHAAANEIPIPYQNAMRRALDIAGLPTLDELSAQERAWRQQR